MGREGEVIPVAGTRKTRKSKVTTDSKGNKVYGPYKGSKKNKGRPMVVKRSSSGKTTSSTAARHEKEKTTGKLPKDKHVAHKEGTTRNATSSKSTRVESRSKNIGDGNRARRKRSR